jgi:hypothetical protein
MGSIHQNSSHFRPLGTRTALKPAYFSRVSGPATHVDTLGRLSESWRRPSQMRLIPPVAVQKLASLAQKREPSRTSIISAVPPAHQLSSTHHVVASLRILAATKLGGLSRPSSTNNNFVQSPPLATLCASCFPSVTFHSSRSYEQRCPRRLPASR